MHTAWIHLPNTRRDSQEWHECDSRDLNPHKSADEPRPLHGRGGEAIMKSSVTGRYGFMRYGFLWTETATLQEILAAVEIPCRWDDLTIGQRGMVADRIRHGYPVPVMGLPADLSSVFSFDSWGSAETNRDRARRTEAA